MKHFTLAFFLVFFGFISLGQTPSDALWTPLSESGLQPQIKPSAYLSYSLDVESLKFLLESAPDEQDVKAKDSNVILSLPMASGDFEEFSIVNSPVMAPELAARYPEIQVYLGQGVTSPQSVVRFDLTPRGFHAMVLGEGVTTYVDPYSPGDLENYIVYTKSSFYATNEKVMECSVDMAVVDDPKISTPQLPVEGKKVMTMGMQKSFANNGTTLRTYRLALACTGEYASYHGGTVSGALAAMNTTMARVNGIFERDVCLRMIMISNNDEIIYLNGNSDPYTNSDGATMLSQNQSVCNSVIGSSNYDIGHVFSTGGGGIASLQSPCFNSYKARGVTGRYAPVGDPFDVDYVAHEMGHQWGGNHTQNNSCNRASSAAYEPGSASTIMGYAGICAPNLQSNSDDHFHNHSINEMINFTVYGNGNSCDTPISTGNSVPTVEAGSSGFYIPANTPFELEAVGSDADGDALTYNWEEYDLGPQTASGDNNLTNPSSTQPIFRSWSSTSSPIRTFPRLSDLVTNSTTIGEHMPDYTRSMTFRCSVRDNVAGGGAFNDDQMSFTVYGNSGPFVVNSPGNILQGNSEVELTWDVAGTDVNPINCSDVQILMSTNGGYDFDVVLLESTPNSGSASITLPNIDSNLVRFKVKAIGNIFFDITNVSSVIVFNEGPDCPGDVNGNGAIEVGDVLLVLSEFGCTSQCTADVDGDGQVTVSDILTLLSNFAQVCE